MLAEAGLGQPYALNKVLRINSKIKMKYWGERAKCIQHYEEKYSS